MKISKKSLLITAVTFATAISASTLAFAATEAQEDAADYRKSTFTMVGHHFGALAAMVKGEVDFDSDVYAKNAEALAAVTMLAPNGFEVEGTIEGSRSKAEIWENKADFDEKLKGFQVASAALAEAAKTGDEKAAKAAFGDVAKTCKGCHTEYRSK